MNPHILDPQTDARLRTLDLAQTPIDRERQAAMLDGILASTPSHDRAATAFTPRPRRSALRWTALAGAAAAVTVGALVLPGLGGDDAAYASWTPTAAPVAPAELDKVVAACRDQIGGLGDSGEFSPAKEGFRAEDLAVRIAERRGSWVFVTLTAPGSMSWVSDCLAELPPGSDQDPGNVSASLTGGGGWAPPQGSELIEGSMSQAGPDTGLFGSGRRETASATNGQIGPDVVGVTIHAGDLTVEASVKDGTYAAWWPGAAFDMPDELPPSGQWDGPPSLVTYDLTLRDGTVLKNATSTYRDPATGEVITPSGPVVSEGTLTS
ncbi:MAG: hypothetical protein KBB39_14480 [Phycicoccus sp.]|nr:hypothetical protein [Phycicoccus sp.]